MSDFTFVGFTEETKMDPNQREVYVILKEDSYATNMVDVCADGYIEAKTWDGRFFISDPYTGLCFKYSDTVEFGYDITDQVANFSEK